MPPSPHDTHTSHTDWAMIAIAAGGDGKEAGDAMERLARRYWPALYAFIRRTGRDVHEATDLTQGFICDVVIGRKLFESADPERGRFRSLLLTSLQNYLRDQNHRRKRIRKPARKEREQSPRQAVRARAAARNALNLRFDQFDDQTSFGAGSSTTPEEAFSAQWSATLVRNVLEQVREACAKDGLEPHWMIFEHRVVRPMLFGEEPTPYPILAERLELEDPAQAPNMMVTVKRRFARSLYLEVCTTVGDAIEAEGELFELLRDLERH